MVRQIYTIKRKLFRGLKNCSKKKVFLLRSLS